MELIKFILILTLSMVLGFGLWYLIFWFVSSESDLFTWHWGVKILYLVFGLSATSSIFEGLVKNI